MEDFEEIKKRVTIEDILNDCGYYPKKRRMACPIHNGQNPTSFSFSDHVYYCHSCGASGGLLDLAQALLKINHDKALQYLAQKAKPQISQHIIARCRQNSNLGRRQPLPGENSYLRDLKLALKGIDTLREHYTNQIKISRGSLRNRTMDPASYYVTVQYAEYVLEELDSEIAKTRHEITVEKRKQRRFRKA